jgi:hypothetical protein
MYVLAYIHVGHKMGTDSIVSLTCMAPCRILSLMKEKKKMNSFHYGPQNLLFSPLTSQSLQGIYEISML